MTLEKRANRPLLSFSAPNHPSTVSAILGSGRIDVSIPFSSELSRRGAAVGRRGFYAAAPNAPRVSTEDDEIYLRHAMRLADEAAASGDVPIGAVLVTPSHTFYARNEKERRPDPTAHAELLALRSAAATLGTWRLSGATLYVTKEPCVMCAGAIVAARIERLVFGARDPKGGAAGSVIDVFDSSAVNHRVVVVAGVLEAETAAQLRAFFSERRKRSVR